ncbi:hypothetical protein FQZ97_1088410 [compost metagenome]
MAGADVQLARAGDAGAIEMPAATLVELFHADQQGGAALRGDGLAEAEGAFVEGRGGIDHREIGLARIGADLGAGVEGQRRAQVRRVDTGGEPELHLQVAERQQGAPEGAAVAGLRRLRGIENVQGAGLGQSAEQVAEQALAVQHRVGQGRPIGGGRKVGHGVSPL